MNCEAWSTKQQRWVKVWQQWILSINYFSFSVILSYYFGNVVHMGFGQVKELSIFHQHLCTNLYMKVKNKVKQATLFFFPWSPLPRTKRTCYSWSFIKRYIWKLSSHRGTLEIAYFIWEKNILYLFKSPRLNELKMNHTSSHHNSLSYVSTYITNCLLKERCAFLLWTYVKALCNYYLFFLNCYTEIESNPASYKITKIISFLLGNNR